LDIGRDDDVVAEREVVEAHRVALGSAVRVSASRSAKTPPTGALKPISILFPHWIASIAEIPHHSPSASNVTGTHADQRQW
jgi:hypothetical protein